MPPRSPFEKSAVGAMICFFFGHEKVDHVDGGWGCVRCGKEKRGEGKP